MNSKNKFDWGQEVEVLPIAPAELNPKQRGSVCGVRQIESENVYLVEFSDGVAVEIPEKFLKRID
ncbi:MAG TPA: hypothetical protein VMF08_14145 [Candidatus Sulfotelmatobacter sp.]|nr:hypothetical protein [Candidatus Sulfotelmatobacter sp.]